MTLSFAAFFALLLLRSHGVRSQSTSLRQGGGGGNSSSSQDVMSTATKQKDNGFEDFTPPSNHRSLTTSRIWVPEYIIDPLAQSRHDGSTLALSGDGTFLASSPASYTNDAGEENVGIVRFFHRTPGGLWNETTELRLPGHSAQDLFGSDVSLSYDGKRVAIGAKYDSCGGDCDLLAGSVWVYERSDDIIWNLLDTLNGGVVQDQLGTSVALSKDGTILAVGAPGNQENGSASGMARVYRWDGKDEVFKKMGGDFKGEAADARSGNSVALSDSGLVLAIGTPYRYASKDKGEPGYVSVFAWDKEDANDESGNWVLRGSPIVGDDGGDYFGVSVDLSGDGNTLAVGASNVDGESGKARLFQWKDNDGEWEQIGSTLTGPPNGAHFGLSVSLSSSGSILAVGSTYFTYTYSVLENSVPWEELANVLTGPVSSLSDGEEDEATIAVGNPTGGAYVTIYSLSNKTSDPTSGPTFGPTAEPTYGPTAVPSSGPTISLSTTSGPTSEPTPGPTPNRVSPPPTFSLGPTSGPTYEPTSGPTYETTSGPTSAPSPSGSNGDPHFRTWNGGHFEYHGQCDMILVKDEAFAEGLGLEVQIRTKLVRFWSFIQNAVLRIGDDTLEMQGSPDLSVNKGNNHYWINKIYQGKVTSLGGFPVKSTYVGKHKNKRWFFSKYGGGNKISRSFEIDLSSKYPGQKIVIGSFKEFVRVDFHNADSDAFGNSVGMLGDFATGKTLARDGVTELKDYTMLGHEWQVLPQDGMLFHNVSHPQFPELCIEPHARAMKRRRRLGESSVTDEQAEAACAPIVDVLDRKDCISDVLATQDLTMVEAY